MPTTRRQRSLQNSAVADTTVSATATGTTSTSTRRSTRRRKAEDIVEDETIPAVVKQEAEVKAEAEVEAEVKAEAEVEAEGPGSDDDNNDNNDNEEGSTKNNTYILDGKEFSSYQDFVAAKRKRNQAVLLKLGFGSSDGGIHKRLKLVSKDTNAATQRGLKSNKRKSAAAAPPVRSRRSSRISGDQTKLVALDMYVNDWHRENAATIVTKGGNGNGNGNGEDDDSEEVAQETFFKGRVNDGSALSLKNAIELNDPKWIHDDSEEIAKDLLNELTTAEGSKEQNKSATQSPVSVVSSSSSLSSWEAELADKVEALSIDKEEWVCKVTPDRIYSVATHPSRSKLICCAGDKQGYVGLWDVDGISGRGNGGKDAGNNGVVSLFRVHSRPICCLEWLNKEHMVTASYDGSVRRLNAETGTFDEIFATYDDSDSTYLEDLGFGLDQGYKYWTQSVTVDHRCKGASNPGLFVSTSKGDVFHVDLRVSNKEKITFHETISEKKINTVSLHPNGTTLAASGNDGVVQLFDIRKFRDSRHSSKSPKPLCAQVAGLSVSSSLFSPSGKSLLTTSFMNRLDLTEDAHLAKGGKTIKPTHSIRHNNQTGRWLTTFQARWHPKKDIFCCGSMNKPRCIEIFDAQGRLLREVTGEALGSVMSRTCFHPSVDKLVLVGGNSSGRMVAVR